MCLATAMVNKSGKETVLAKNISTIRVEGGSVLTLETPAPAEVVFGGRKVTLKAGRHVVKGGAKGK